jgi:hypothetical protein
MNVGPKNHNTSGKKPVPNCTPPHHPMQNAEHYTMMLMVGTVGVKIFENICMKNCCTIPTQNPMGAKRKN